MTSDPTPATGRTPVWVRVLPLAVLLALLAWALLSGVTDRLSLSSLRDNREALRDAVEARPLLSLLIFTAVYAAVTALSIPGAVFVTLAGGFLFGVMRGSIATTIGATIGATVVFLIVRLAAGDMVRRRLGDRAARFETGFTQNAFFYLLSLRLIPVAPFWLVNLAAGAFRTPLRDFVAATFLGVIPAVVIYSGVGASLDAIFAENRTPDLSLILDLRVLLPLLGLAALSLAPAAFKAWRKRSRPA